MNHYHRGFPHGLMFHRFHLDGAESGWQGALTPHDLELILHYVGVSNILKPEEWMEKLNNNTLSPNDLCLTFDDGLLSQKIYALPVLEAYGLHAFFFVYSSVFDGRPVRSEIYSYAASKLGGMDIIIDEFLSRCPTCLMSQLESTDFFDYERQIKARFPFYSSRDINYRFLRGRCQQDEFDRIMDLVLDNHGLSVAELATQLWMSVNDIKDLSRAGHCIGLHSHEHPYSMASLSKETQLEQYKTNLTKIIGITGQIPACVAHPLGSYNDDTLEVLSSIGITCGFRSDMQPPHAAPVNACTLQMAREDSTNLLHMAKLHFA